MTLLPIALWQLDLPIISNTYGEDYELFELFGFCASVGLVVSAGIELRKQHGAPFERVLQIVLSVLVSFHFLGLVAEYSFKQHDYGLYEYAANAIIQGTNPYGEGYLYPPFTAQVMALAYQCIGQSAALVHADLGEESVWGLIFYLYQCGQFILVSTAYFLCCRFARNIGMRNLPALALVATLFLVNAPLIRTLRHNQINLWVLNLILLAILLLRTYPVLSGLAVALGGHIKLYPLAFLLPWIITKRWRAVTGSIAGFLGIVFVQTNGGRDWRLWHQFLAFSRLFPTGTQFRDNSLHSIVHNFLRVGDLLVGKGTAGLQAFEGAIVVAITLAIVAWFAIRFVERERAYLAHASTVTLQNEAWRDTLRSYGHLVDAVALALLIAPRVWEHHYVLAIPIVLWAIATRWRDRPWQVGVGAFLILVLPTFDVFPFSYHRIAGLLMLLWLASPKALHESWITAGQVSVPVGAGE